MQKKQELIGMPSYTPTNWSLLNRIFDFVDRVTNGRADWVQRFISFSFIGGIAALVNLAVFSLIIYKAFNGQHDIVQNIIASALSAEISIMANFLLNDATTFKNLSGQQRTRLQRGLRFHATAISGSVLTFVLQFAFTFFLHLPALVSQAIAILIVLFYNFAFHHLFTYREVKHLDA